MRRVVVGLIAALLAAWPARAAYYEFTGTISIAVGSKRFLPKGPASLSGSGVGLSTVAPSNAIQLEVVSGFTGTLETDFASTAGYTQQAFLTAIGDGGFSKPSVPAGLHGKMAVRGVAIRRGLGQPYAAFPFAEGDMTGLGLGGTVPAVLGSTPAVLFGTWTTGPVTIPSVIRQEHPALGTYTTGTLSAQGFDARTTMGMGTVQLVTPIVTVFGSPADRAAIARLTLTFAPEPGRAALLVAACAALAMLGARRARR